MSRRSVLVLLAGALVLQVVAAPGLALVRDGHGAAADVGGPDGGAALTDTSLTTTPTPLLTDTPTVEATALPTSTDSTDGVVGTATADSPTATLDATAPVDGATGEALGDATDDTLDLADDLSGAVSADGALAVDGLASIETSLEAAAGHATATPSTTPADATGPATTTATDWSFAPGPRGAPREGPAGADGPPVDPLVGGAVLGGTAVVAGLLGRQLALGATRPGLGVALEGTGRGVWARAGRVAADVGDRFGPVLGPLGYQRYDDSDPLEHPGRERLYEAVRDRPGTHLSAVSEAAGLPLSTARYHLRVLEHEGLVHTAKRGGRRRFYPPDVEGEALAAALADEAPAAVLRALAGGGPASVSELAERLDRDPSTVSHHLDRLAAADLVEREREGRAVVSRLAPSVEAAVAGEDPAERARPPANA